LTAEYRSPTSARTGWLVINADDWGRDAATTDRTLDCIRAGSVSAVSAMMFMEDSERAAAIAREEGIDTGLHLNFTCPFSANRPPARLVEHQQRLSAYLRSHRFASAVFHPRLTRSFEYVIETQLEEFRRLYDVAPARLDGHHHMHLCANIVFCRLLPAGALVRRNFSFGPGEKSIGNRVYRAAIDRVVSRRHRMMDFFFALPPFERRERLDRIFSLASRSAVEMETHPINSDEHRFLTGSELEQRLQELRVARPLAPIPASSDAQLPDRP